MLLPNLIASLRLDLADPNGQVFSDEVLGRCILKSVYPLARDLNLSLRVEGGQVVPEPSGEALELLLLIGQIHACQFMRSSTASAFSFSSGDKRIDKTKQPEHWAKLEADLMKSYQQRVSTMNQPDQDPGDPYLITPRLTPVVFERGRDVD